MNRRFRVASDQRQGRDGDRGSVTLELAIGFVVVVLLLLTAATGVSAVTTHLECVDAARQAARAAARGESGEAAGKRAAPEGATVVVRVEGDLVRATVRARTRSWGGVVPSLPTSATAVAEREPGVVS